MQTCFSEFQARKNILRCLAPASRIEARATVALGVHRGTFGEQQLRSRDMASGCRPLQRRGASGAFLQKPVWPLWASAGRRGAEADAPRGRRTWWECWAELYARSTDKQMMNVFDSTFSNSSKQNIFTRNNKHIEQVSWHFVSNKLHSMKRCLLLIV